MDFSLRFGTPAAPSVDHVLEKAHGGCSHPSNLKLAHAYCNNYRSNGSGDPRDSVGYRKVLNHLRRKGMFIGDERR